MNLVISIATFVVATGKDVLDTFSVHDNIMLFFFTLCFSTRYDCLACVVLKHYTCHLLWMVRML